VKGFAKPLDDLINEFAKFPGIGRRSAERFALHILQIDKGTACSLADAIRRIKETIRFCATCNNFSEQETCHICGDPLRDSKTICVVEDPKDVGRIEKLGIYKGVYHVLLGKISPLEGVGPEALSVNKLLIRLRKVKANEIILAVGSSTDGETTALFIGKLLRPLNIKITRIACGIPVGSSLEYTDSATLIRSLEDRKPLTFKS